MPKLNTFVHVAHVDDDGVSRSGVFGPADELPDWAVRGITNPHVWDGEAPTFTEEEVPDPDPGAGAGEGDGDLAEPPRSGKGSGLDAWTAYAEKLGFEVAPGTSRDDIIAAIDAEKE